MRTSKQPSKDADGDANVALGRRATMVDRATFDAAFRAACDQR